MVFVEQGSLRNFTGLRVNDSPPNHAFARHFETDTLQCFPRRFIEGGDRFAVEIREDRNIHQLSCVVLKEDLKGFTEFIQVSRRHVKVLDFKIVVDLEHQHLADGVNAFENREIPPTVQHAAHFPNETGNIRVGLCENTNGTVFTARTHQVVDLIGRTEEGFRFRNQRHHFGNPSRLFEVHERNRQVLETARDVEPKRTGLDGTHSTNHFFKRILKRQCWIDILHSMEQ